MQQQFGVSTDSIQWVSTAYTLCLGVIVPTSAWLGERIGLKAPVCGLAAHVLGFLRAVRDGRRPEQHDLLPDLAGHPWRGHPGDLPDDSVQDGAQGQDRRRDGPVRTGHRGRGPVSARPSVVISSSTSIGG